MSSSAQARGVGGRRGEGGSAPGQHSSFTESRRAQRGLGEARAALPHRTALSSTLAEGSLVCGYGCCLTGSGLEFVDSSLLLE